MKIFHKTETIDFYIVNTTDEAVQIVAKDKSGNILYRDAISKDKLELYHNLYLSTII